MKERCNNSACKNYKNYGGRGISYCERWASFPNFFADMGRRPTPQHSIDRYPDNDGNYEPGNVRWATRKEQNRNYRQNVFVHINGQRMALIEAVEKCGGNYSTIKSRIYRGKSVEQALGLTTA